jgi:hypothetical protein
MHESLYDLLVQMIAYPTKRIDASEIRNSNYYREHITNVTKDQEIALTMLPDNCYGQLQIREFYPYGSLDLDDLVLTSLDGLFSTVSIDLTFHMIKILNAWIYDLTLYFGSPISVYYTYLTILYAYLYMLEKRQKPISRSKLQEIGAACYYIASASKEIPVDIDEMVTMMENAVLHDNLVLRIKLIQIALSFNFTFSTAYDYLNFYNEDKNIDDNRKRMSHDILLLLTSYSLMIIKYSPDVLAKLAVDLSHGSYIDPKILNDIQTVISTIRIDPDDKGGLRMHISTILEYLKKTYPRAK